MILGWAVRETRRHMWTIVYCVVHLQKDEYELERGLHHEANE